MTQLLAQAGPYTLTKTWYVDGTATDVGAVTVGVDDGNGDEVVASGTATTNNGDGTYTYQLADQANPNQLTITWTRTDTSADLVDRVELVGGWLFTENQARTFAAKADAAAANKPLASETEYTDGMIADERTRITDDFERWTGRSWIPRYARVELSGNGRRELDLRKGICRTSDGYSLNRQGRFQDVGVILAATQSGASITTSNISVKNGRLWLESGVWTAATSNNPYNVVVQYVYGVPDIVDGVDRMGLKLLVDRLVPSSFNDRAISVDTEYGITRFVQPGGPMQNVSRIPEVNEWVASHNHKVLVG